MPCCDLTNLVGQKMPFGKVMAIEYGEGRPVAGLAKCERHGTCFRFQQLDYHALDDTPIYGFATISEDYYVALLKYYQKYGRPRWPVWVPATREQIPITQYESIVQLEDTIWAHGRIELVVAARNVTGAVVRAAAVVPNNWHQQDWVNLLSL